MTSAQGSGITVIGAGWCPHCKRVKKFLTAHRVPYHNVDIDEQGGGDRDPIIEVDILISAARHHDGVALCVVELSLQFGTEVKDEGFLLNAAKTPGAAVDAAVTRIKDDDRLGEAGGYRRGCG